MSAHTANLLVAGSTVALLLGMLALAEWDRWLQRWREWRQR